MATQGQGITEGMEPLADMLRMQVHHDRGLIGDTQAKAPVDQQQRECIAG